jgi:hypothetical protein
MTVSNASSRAETINSMPAINGSGCIVASRAGNPPRRQTDFLPSGKFTARSQTA